MDTVQTNLEDFKIQVLVSQVGHQVQPQLHSKERSPKKRRVIFAFAIIYTEEQGKEKKKKKNQNTALQQVLQS